MAFDVRSEILAAIGKTEDHNMKAVLLLMLSVLEDIGGRIDSMMASEVRKLVLNGHEVDHHAHHDWIALKILAEENDKVDDRKSKRRIRDGLIEKILWVALVAIAGSGWLIR